MYESIKTAQSVAAWAGHQWGSAEIPVPPYDLPVGQWAEHIAQATRDTTFPGVAGWGITAPEITSGGTVIVRVGRGLTVMVTATHVRAEYRARERGRLAAISDGSEIIFDINNAADPAPRDYARVLAALLAAGVDEHAIARAIDRAGVWDDQEFQRYWRVRDNAGHLLAGPCDDAA